MWLFSTEVTISEKKDPSNNRGGEGRGEEGRGGERRGGEGRGGEGRVERRSEFPVL